LQQPAGNEFHIEPSTAKSYKDIFKKYIQPSALMKTKLIDFTPTMAQRFMESVDQKLAHQTHLRVRAFMSGVFTWAISDGVIKTNNPFDSVKTGGSNKKDFGRMDDRQRKIAVSNEHAYTLEEVAVMLDKLPEPARTLCAVAAFTGLTRSELRGLKWSDYDGETIHVQRKVWGNYVGAPKTEAREAGVEVIPTLKKILAKYKASEIGRPVGEGWMFYGAKSKKPLNLENLTRRDIPIFLNGAWHGFHAFRRGLGTRLNEFGVDSETIQAILRHSDVSTTSAYYILPDRTKTAAAMKKMDAVLRKYNVKA
jgi:integrase